MAVVRRASSTDLQKFLKSTRGGRLLGAVERHLMTRPLGVRRSNVIHPSDLAKPGWCPREQYFRITTGNNRESRNSLRTQNVFDTGHDIHHKWQKRFADMGNLYGQWFCENCEHAWWALSPEVCENCDSPFFRYNEVPVSDVKRLIVGHADGWVHDIGADALIEIKSVGSGTVRWEMPELLEKHDGNMDGAWSDIKRPFASHLCQGLLYLELLHNQATWEYPAPEEIVFIYEYKANQDTKEFTVQRNRSIVQSRLDGAEQVAQAVRAGKAPACPSRICSECRKYKDAA